MEDFNAARERFDAIPVEDVKGRETFRRVMASRSCYEENGEWFFRRLDGSAGGPYKDPLHADHEARRYYSTYGTNT